MVNLQAALPNLTKQSRASRMYVESSFQEHVVQKHRVYRHEEHRNNSGVREVYVMNNFMSIQTSTANKELSWFWFVQSQSTAVQIHHCIPLGIHWNWLPHCLQDRWSRNRVFFFCQTTLIKGRSGKGKAGVAQRPPALSCPGAPLSLSEDWHGAPRIDGGSEGISSTTNKGTSNIWGRIDYPPVI